MYWSVFPQRPVIVTYLYIRYGSMLANLTQFLVPFVALGFLFPISQPHPLSTRTTFGVKAAVNGTRMKMKLLCIAYANANWVQMPVHRTHQSPYVLISAHDPKRHSLASALFLCSASLTPWS